MSRKELSNQIVNEVKNLRRYALALTRNATDAEDLVQDCLTRAIASSHTWKPGSNMRSWLFKIMHNIFIDEIRRNRLREAAKKDSDAQYINPPQPATTELGQVLEALSRLPEIYREPIILVAINDMTYAQAAEIIDVPLGTLMSRLSRARQALRRAVQGEDTPHLRLVS